MARFLLATLPITGHVQPVKPVARRLVERGHEVGWYTGSRFRALVEATGARYFGQKHGLEFDDRNIEATFPRDKKLRGHAGFHEDVLRILIGSARGQVLDLQEILATFSPDALISELTFAGAWVIAGQRNLPWAVLGISALPLGSTDTAPFGTGIPPSSTRLGHLRNRLLRALARHVALRKLQARANRELEDFGLPGLGHTVLDATVLGCNLFLQATVPAFEYPRSDMAEHVRFIGALLPDPPERTELPTWWPQLGDTRPVVHVTQGTFATDHEELLVPSLRALADEDVTVVAATGGRELSVTIPGNARVERFLPYHALMPHVTAMVTNGGYGGVQFALAHGVPLVAAGQTEEKAEISARIAWSGAGIDLKSSRPSVDAIRRAVRRVLREPTFKAGAVALQTALSKYDAADEAANELEALAEQRHANAQVHLGLTYQKGRGVPRDDAEAVKWYRRAAAQGHVNAQVHLGQIYQQGHGVPRDDAEAVKWYQRAAEQGDARARTNLGWMHEKGQGVPRDYAEAVRWYRQAAERGHANAQVHLARMYQQGRGVPRDDAEAVKWCRQAALQGHAGAQTNLGGMHANGLGVSQNLAEAARWYRQAAEQGHANAQIHLGQMYLEGRGVPRDGAEAERWYRRAAEQDHVRAQTNLGSMYQQGRGVPRDYAEAVRWYRRAAEQGRARAQTNLAFLYERGRGVPRDYAEAVSWYRQAALQGYARAQRSLGEMYQLGRGVPRDDAKALKWLHEAAVQGEGRAQEILRERGLTWEVEAELAVSEPASGVTRNEGERPGADQSN